MKMDLNILLNVLFYWFWYIDKGEKMVRNEEGRGVYVYMIIRYMIILEMIVGKNDFSIILII